MKTLLLPFFLAVSMGAQTFSLDPSAWILTGAKDYSKSLYAVNGALAFDFPAQKQKAVDYLYTQPAMALVGSALNISVQIISTGSPIFAYDTEKSNTCIFPAHFRAYFETDLAYLTPEANAAGAGRWWANPVAIELMPGTFMISIPLTPDQWTDFYGDRGDANATTLAGFQNAMAHPINLGGVFGGGCFFGHGVYVTGGTAQFQLMGYSVQ